MKDWPNAQDLKILSDESVEGEKCWHISGKLEGDSMEWWIRQKDGYPGKVVQTTDQGKLTLVYKNFNSGVTIELPPESEIE